MEARKEGRGRKGATEGQGLSGTVQVHRVRVLLALGRELPRKRERRGTVGMRAWEQGGRTVPQYMAHQAAVQGGVLGTQLLEQEAHQGEQEEQGREREAMA